MLLQEAEVWQQFRGKTKVQVGSLSSELLFGSSLCFVSVSQFQSVPTGQTAESRNGESDPVGQ